MDSTPGTIAVIRDLYRTHLESRTERLHSSQTVVAEECGIEWGFWSVLLGQLMIGFRAIAFLQPRRSEEGRNADQFICLPGTESTINVVA